MALLKLSLITALIGITALVWLSLNLEPKLISISSINSELIDSWVKVKGSVVEQKQFEGLTLLNLRDDSGEIKVISRMALENLTSKQVEVIGKVVEYKGQIEIEATQIKYV